ncbi:DUF3139 domain-containing protein [Sporosarcina ureilytica]|uniref:DUF3139 domain-containing protein n=1 Tax=Sporosarcina ureilytica TaxID=298596 RepID=UPI00094BF69B|nr:DUF3139 domain-containing protein [Sporosarcina ureilytica]
MKKTGIILSLVIIFVGIGFGYIQYKKSDVEKSVLEYLTTEKNISKDDIVASEPFIANLAGDKKWMISIKLKNDDRTYYYYKSRNEIILESFVENGVEYVQ